MAIRADYSLDAYDGYGRQGVEWRWVGLGLGLPVVFLIFALVTHDADASKRVGTTTISISDDAGAALAEVTSVTPEAVAAEAALEVVKINKPRVVNRPAKIAAPAKQKTQGVAALPLHHLPLPIGHNWKDISVQKNDSGSALFTRHGIDQAYWGRFKALGGEAARIERSLRPKETLRVRTASDGRILELLRKLDDERTLHVYMDNNRLAQKIIESPVDRLYNRASGVVTSSFWNDAAAAGLSDRAIAGLYQIFAWDIDFGRELQGGEKFSVIYEELYRDNKKLRDGNIIAAEFITKNKSFRAVRFTDEDGNTGYYTEDGNPLRKAFLRNPVAFSRISSRFTHNRWHPVLKRWRSHKGVDYAAARGTSIKSAGNGRIVFRGWKGGYGNCVVVQHGGKYRTLYGHMSRFQRGQQVGSRVSQGDVIGYVGSTGLATGPHLHYEFLVNGSHVDPLSVNLPRSIPLPESEMPRFRKVTGPILAQLDAISQRNLAQR